MSEAEVEVLNNENQHQIDDKAGGEKHHYQFKVKMSCGGCSGAVDRALKKLFGTEYHEITINLQEQKVDVLCTIAYDEVLAAIKKTGKVVLSGEELPILPDDLTA